MSSFTEQTVQIVGSLFILVPFVLAQRGVLRTSAPSYLVANLIGSTALALDALHGSQWGFLLLEGVWALVSAVALAGRLRGRADRRQDVTG